MLHTRHQVLATALHRLVDDLRIGEGNVGGTDGIQELAQVEDHLTLLMLIQSLHFSSGLEQGRGGQQIALFESVEDRILLPGGVAEALIPFLRRDHWLDILTTSRDLESSCGHHLRVLLDEIAIGSPGAAWVARGIEPELLEGTGDLGGIKRHQFAVGVGFPELINHGDPWVLSTFRCLLSARLYGWISLHGTLN